MKKLLFLLFQAFLCIGSAKDADSSSLGRGYSADNSAVSAQIGRSSNPRARLADVIYIAGVGPKIYQDFIKFWDGQKEDDFLKSVVHLAQQYPVGVDRGDRDQYWTELFTYLLQREPQLYEALKKFPRVSGFINANAKYFDEIVQTAKEKIEELREKINNIPIHFNRRGARPPFVIQEDIKPFIDFIRENNINLRKPIEIIKKLLVGNETIEYRTSLLKIILESINGFDNETTHNILELVEFDPDLKNNKELNDIIFGYSDFDKFKMFIDHGFGRGESALYKIIRYWAGSQPDKTIPFRHWNSFDKESDKLNARKLRYLIDKGFKYSFDADDAYKINLPYGPDGYGRIPKIEFFIDMLITIGMKNPENLLNHPQICGNLDLFKQVETYLDEKGIKHGKIKNSTYEKADHRVKKYIDNNYIKIEDNWLKKGVGTSR